MATVITVHGTGATGPEEGDRWWQRGSPFEQQLKDLVQSVDGGEIAYRPVVWDGWNSEASRRRAAEKLKGLLRQCEERGEKYVLVGHSHGGSVIANMLIETAARKNKLPNLKSWITVGTPFIQFSRSPFLYARLGTIGRAFYVSTLTYCLVLGAWFVIEGAYRSAAPSALLTMFALSLLPFMFFYVIAQALSSRRVLFWSRRRRLAQRQFGPRWISLCHPNDEALQGLRALQTLNTSVFPSDFAAAAFSTLSIFVLPAIFLLAASSATINAGVYEFVTSHASYLTQFPQIAGGPQPNGGRGFIASLYVVIVGLFVVLSWPFRALNYLPTNATNVPLFFAVFPAALFAGSLVIVLAITKLGRYCSALLSKLLNRMTWGQIRRTVLGSDVGGERAIGVDEFPVWINERFTFLPPILSEEISRLSNESGATSLAKFRQALSGLSANGFSDFANYLTWDELVHTCYFKSPKFQKLMACAISTTDGFAPSPRLKADPEYAAIAQCFSEMGRRGARANEMAARTGEVQVEPISPPTVRSGFIQ